MDQEGDLAGSRVAQLLAGVEEGRPLVMINLLRYRAQADYGGAVGVEPCSGREAYQRYAAEAIGFITAVDGEVMWRGSGKAVIIGEPGERWDKAILVRYPSKTAFLKMVSDPDYQAITFHRTAALEESRLIATTAA